MAPGGAREPLGGAETDESSSAQGMGAVVPFCPPTPRARDSLAPARGRGLQSGSCEHSLYFASKHGLLPPDWTPLESVFQLSLESTALLENRSSNSLVSRDV